MRQVKSCKLLAALLLALLGACQTAPPAVSPTLTLNPGASPPPRPAALATPLPSATAAAPPSSTPDPRCQFGGLPGSLWFYESAPDPDFWQRASPEEVGLDPERLAQGMAELAQSPALRSFLLIRNGQLVIERYYHGETAEQSREIASASKSVLSALVGIALEQGILEGVDQTLEALLPAAFEGGVHPDKAQVTLEQLLTMRSGFSWEPRIVAGRSAAGEVSVPLILEAPMAGAPGADFIYNTGATHLVSAILTEASGMSTCQFAYRYLFDPLNITAEWWNQDREGVYTGGWNLYLSPRELAKFGLLYLQGGEWEGQQVIPRAWVEASLSARATASAGSETYYGYWWWLSWMWDYEIYSARGGGEQMIYLVPELELVVVTTSDHAAQGRPEQFDSLSFLWQTVLPAAVLGQGE